MTMCTYHVYRDVQAVMFVVDSSDKLRMPIAKEELELLLRHPGTDAASRTIPVCFFPLVCLYNYYLVEGRAIKCMLT